MDVRYCAHARETRYHHLYECECLIRSTTDKPDYRCLVQIKAHNRTQAAALLRKVGWIVCSVNMVA